MEKIPSQCACGFQACTTLRTTVAKEIHGDTDAHVNATHCTVSQAAPLRFKLAVLAYAYTYVYILIENGCTKRSEFELPYILNRPIHPDDPRNRS